MVNPRIVTEKPNPSVATASADANANVEKSLGEICSGEI